MLSIYFKKCIKTFKFLFIVHLLSLLTLILSSCSINNSSINKTFVNNTTASSIVKSIKTIADKKMAVVYFSISGNTEKVAEKIAETFGLEMIKIEPTIPYEESDFIMENTDTRPIRESKINVFEEDAILVEQEYPVSFGIATESLIKETSESQAIAEMPEIKSINVNQYDIIFLGYPIWYNDAPKVIYTFVKNLKNKTIIPFCTSDNDSIATSEEKLSNYVDMSVQVMSGKRFTPDITIDELKIWFKDLSVDIN